MRKCHLCRAQEVTELLDFGLQPVCNRFLRDPEEPEYLHPMLIGQCHACGIVQIIDPVPPDELKPRYDWITYTEPEAHLDSLADIISSLPEMTSGSLICGVSFKDDSTLARMNKRGFTCTWRVDPESDLCIGDPGVGVETVQDKLDVATADRLAERHGKADVVIARHIVEHAHDVLEFVGGLKRLLRPAGYIIFEVPDCTAALDHCDFTTLWEEHIVYFTPDTFRSCFAWAGLSLIRFEWFPYPLESSLVGIAQLQEREEIGRPLKDVADAEKLRARSFVGGLPERRAKLQRVLAEHREKVGRIALFGAGHLSCAFINLLDLGSYIEFLADDHPRKKGLFMPGSRLPILGSDALMERDVKLCLLGVNPGNEEKVIQQNRKFLERGGTVLSIFPSSRYSMEA